MKTWHVIADPAWKGKHLLHDARFVATCDDSKIEVTVDGTEYGEEKSWRFEDPEDSIICTMPDSPNQKEHAHLIAAAPDLLEACKAAMLLYDLPNVDLSGPAQVIRDQLRAVIQKAESAS